MEPAPNPNNGVTFLLAEIDRIAQELRALNKRPSPATEDQVKKLIQNEKERPIIVPAEKVVEQLMGKTGERVTQFQSIYKQFITQLNDQTRILRQELTTQAAAMQAAAAAVQASAVVVTTAAKGIPSSVPVKGEVFGFTNRITAGGTVVVSALLGALLLSALSSKVSKEDYEQLQAKEQKWTAANAKMAIEGKYYFDQIRRYKAKNPKTTYFPAYRPAE